MRKFKIYLFCIVISLIAFALIKEQFQKKKESPNIHSASAKIGPAADFDEKLRNGKSIEDSDVKFSSNDNNESDQSSEEKTDNNDASNSNETVQSNTTDLPTQTSKVHPIDQLSFQQFLDLYNEKNNLNLTINDFQTNMLQGQKTFTLDLPSEMTLVLVQDLNDDKLNGVSLMKPTGLSQEDETRYGILAESLIDLINPNLRWDTLLNELMQETQQYKDHVEAEKWIDGLTYRVAQYLTHYEFRIYAQDGI